MTTLHTTARDDDGEYVKQSTFKAYVAYQNGFVDGQQNTRASELWDLLHELAPFIPGDFQSKVQSQLDAGV